MRINTRSHVEAVRRQARAVATRAGFARDDVEAIVLAVSELATNLLRYAPGGVITIAPLVRDGDMGIIIESRDTGPGIADVELALRDGFSTSGGLGSGLPAVRRLMDELEIATSAGETRIEARKWLMRRS